MQLLNELMDRGGNYVAAALPFIVSLLTRGLARRALLVAHSLPNTPEVTQWAVTLHPLLPVRSFMYVVALLDAGEGILGHQGENGPLWGMQGLEPFTWVWGAVGKLSLG